MQTSHTREGKVVLAQAKTTIMVSVQALPKKGQLVQTLKESPIKKMHITSMVHLPIHLVWHSSIIICLMETWLAAAIRDMD